MTEPTATDVALNKGDVWTVIESIYETGQQPGEWAALVDQLVEHLEAADDGVPAPAVERSEALLLPHFERSMRLVLHGARSGPEKELLDAIPFPLMVITGDRRIVYVSEDKPPRLAEDGALRVEGDLLQICDAEIERQVDALFELGTDAPVRILDAEEQQQLVGLSLRGPSGSAYVALLWLSRARWFEVHMEPIQHFYGLTPAETRVLEVTLRRSETAEVARELSLAEDTVRTQLKRIYQKTGTAGKMELVQKLLSGPAVLGVLGSTGRRMTDAPSCGRTEQLLTLADGARMAFAEYGDPAGTPVLKIHNLFASRLQIAGPDHELRKLGLRLIVPDRPGFGMSDWREDVTPRSYADDLVALADHLGIDRFAVLGGAVGAVYALAAARHRPDRVSRCTVMNCVPEVRSRSDLAGLAPHSRRLFKLVLRAPRLADSVLRLITPKGAERFAQHVDLTPPDREIAETPSVREQAFAGLHETLRQGHAALIRDVHTMAKPWGFEVRDIEVPVQCWLGGGDTVAPLPIMQPLLDSIPNREIFVVPDGSHFMLVRVWSDVITRLADPDGPMDARALAYLEDE